MPSVVSMVHINHILKPPHPYWPVDSSCSLCPRGRSRIKLGPSHIKGVLEVTVSFSQTMSPPRFELPPGPSYILRQLLSWKVVSYGAFVGCVCVGGEALGIDPPLWTIVSCSILALPAILYAQTEFQYWTAKRRAESLGARLAPRVPSKWPAGVDLIVAMIDVFKTGYLGESCGLGIPCAVVS